MTVEPCNHHGRTPPCHQALIDAGITKVLIAVIDPTSRGRGGAARLRDAGSRWRSASSLTRRCFLVVIADHRDQSDRGA
ncbi:hypothetical protein ALI144C_25545 [Actinosynnema sp. ALI-1.44]|nr:hypothetical protein ALI144C_25545 [Actinosynnema sp. ALI-1.44]